MGAGASRNHHSKGIPSPPRESLSPVKDTVQPKIPVQDQHFSHEAQNKDIKEQVHVARTSQTSTDKKASPNDTLETYKAKYPYQAEDLETMLERLQALKNFVDKNLNDLEDYAKVGRQTIHRLFVTSVHTYESTGTQEEKQFITLMEFTIDVGGAEQLKLFVQHCFKKFSYLIKEESDDEDSVDKEEPNDNKKSDEEEEPNDKEESDDEEEPNDNGESDDEEETEDYTCYDCLCSTLGVIQNFSDFHQGFCSACARAGIISMCFEIIKQIDAENSNWEEKDLRLIAIIDSSVGILHNISRRVRDRELFGNREQTLLYFAKKNVPTIAALSLLTLAYLVDENTNHLILADENLLSFLITLLDEAWQSEDRRSTALFSAKELAEGLSHLAINDANKNILGQNGIIPVLISVIKTSNEDEEKASATRALWMLAFDDNNKKEIRQEEGAMDILHQLQQSENPEVQKAAAGALWEIEGKTARHLERIESTGNHVMISYQWDSQEVLVEVKNRLQASGYRVWMDLEQMGGSTLETMAKAVENSSVVLVCVSERYKESPNCRSEAEYTYKLGKDIIPLMMQRNYKPDGWLGMLLGTKFWIDFHSKHIVKTGVTKLIKELGGRGKDVDVTDGPSEPVVQAVQADIVATLPSSLGVSTWTNEEVKQWLKEIGLEKVCKEDISRMNGQSLTDLQKLREECPEYFYRCLERDLNLTNMVDIFTFTKGLGELC
ncbi:uncharacterized protein [Porites lutea]|uniref:uncharacterized protein n=1 Tax=Porites lutea TaxID=51062 RepID=UPI003CC513C9